MDSNHRHTSVWSGCSCLLSYAPYRTSGSIMNTTSLFSIAYGQRFRNCYPCNAMGRDGVEPTESEDNRFTVCPASTYGISSHTCNPAGVAVPASLLTISVILPTWCVVATIYHLGLRGALSFQLSALTQGIRYACYPGGITTHAGRGL